MLMMSGLAAVAVAAVVSAFAQPTAKPIVFRGVLLDCPAAHVLSVPLGET